MLTRDQFALANLLVERKMTLASLS